MASDPSEPSTPAAREHRAALHAAAFLLSALGAAIAVVLLLGSAHRTLESHRSFVVHFPEVDGLKVDAPVRLGGLTVGRVTELSFSDRLDDTRIRVKVQLARQYASRIRSDSVARVGSRGLLGDKT